MLSAEMSIFADENTEDSGVSRNIVSKELSIKVPLITLAVIRKLQLNHCNHFYKLSREHFLIKIRMSTVYQHCVAPSMTLVTLLTARYSQINKVIPSYYTMY